jgi:hypothetical protein
MKPWLQNHTLVQNPKTKARQLAGLSLSFAVADAEINRPRKPPDKFQANE